MEKLSIYGLPHFVVVAVSKIISIKNYCTSLLFLFPLRVISWKYHSSNINILSLHSLYNTPKPLLGFAMSITTTTTSIIAMMILLDAHILFHDNVLFFIYVQKWLFRRRKRRLHVCVYVCCVRIYVSIYLITVMIYYYSKKLYVVYVCVCIYIYINPRGNFV